MGKYINILGGFYFAYIASSLAFNNNMPDKTSVICMGIICSMGFFADAMRGFLKEHLAKKVKDKYNDQINPILNNQNLTDEQKKVKIGEVLEKDFKEQLKSLGGNDE
jgi:hypothetical protein